MIHCARTATTTIRMTSTDSDAILDLGPKVTVLPVLYGSGDFAIEVRRLLAGIEYDCLAVPLPPSMSAPLEEGVGLLPRVSVVLQEEVVEAVPDSEAADRSALYNFVPIDPCQAVIAAIREANARGADVACVDLEVSSYDEGPGLRLADPYALKQVRYEKLLASLVPSLPAPELGSQRQERIRRMAFELHCLELEYDRIVFVCSIEDWPWVRQAYRSRSPFQQHATAAMPRLSRVADDDLYFVLGELPFITYLYEHRRAEFIEGRTLAIEGVKALMLEARDRWRGQVDFDHHWLTPHRLGLMLRYLRNRCIMDGRLTPDLYNLAVAGREAVGDDYALSLIEAARDYPPQKLGRTEVFSGEDSPDVRFGLDTVAVGEGDGRRGKNRLRGVPLLWRTLSLKASSPAPRHRRDWTKTNWDPMGQCSYAPEDRRIESFQQHVRKQARQLLGEEGHRVEPFTASLLDGLDIRETLRNWHTGNLYVKELPPSRGTVEIVIFLFEPSPVAAEKYPWRGTWYAEHEEESTLCFFATHYAESMVGPGIGQAVYGGCFFIFPPRPIADIWRDRGLADARGCDERLLLGALAHSREKRVVLVSPQRPSARWRRLARERKKQLVYIPLHRFSSVVVERLRRFHVLNGRHVRSYASRFIQDMR